jgi:hypothetical protein
MGKKFHFLGKSVISPASCLSIPVGLVRIGGEGEAVEHAFEFVVKTFLGRIN